MVIQCLMVVMQSGWQAARMASPIATAVLTSARFSSTFFMNSWTKKIWKPKLKKSTLAALWVYTVRGERFQCIFSSVCVHTGPYKPPSWCLWYFLSSSERCEEVKGLHKNDCLCYRRQEWRRTQAGAPFPRLGVTLVLFWVHFSLFKKSCFNSLLCV